MKKNEEYNTTSAVAYNDVLFEAGDSFDMETFTSELNREYHENGRVARYSIRDKFVLACLDEKDYPEVEFLADVFQRSFVNQKNNLNNNREL